MRIALPLEGFNASGGVRIITEIVNSLSRRGHDVEILVPDYAGMSSFAIDGGVKICIIKAKRKKAFAKLFYRAVLCLRAARNCDVCIATGYKTPYYIYISKIINRSAVKPVYVIQGYEPVSHVLNIKTRWLAKSFLYFLAWFSFKLPFTKIAVSTWVKEKIGDPTITVIPNGVDLNIFAPVATSKTSRFVVGVIGSNIMGKGYHIFIEAIQRIPFAERREINVVVATKGMLPMPDGVVSEIVSPQNDGALAEFYRRCDVFVYPSIIEGFGLPPLEAMACGVPVVVSECGGVGMYAHSHNSILVKPGDPGELAKAIVTLKCDAGLREALRKNGIRTASRFSVQRMRDEYVRRVEGL